MDESPELVDLEIQCVECQVWFFFGVGEHQFYLDQGFDLPRRCRPCREAKKSRVLADRRTQERQTYG